MVLSYEDIKMITFGAVESLVDEAGIQFYRMPIKHIRLIQKNNEDYGVRALSTAGIAVDFYTDSNFFAFSYDDVQRASSRNWYYFSLYVDGKEWANIGEEKAELFCGSYCTDLPKGRKRITLFFPNLFRARLNKIELSDNAIFEPVKKERKVLFIGDSITQGADAKCAANSYVNRFAYKTNSEVINTGVGGARFEEYWIDSSFSYNPDIVIVALGTNAWRWNTKDYFQQTCDKLLKEVSALYFDKPIFLILPIRREESYSEIFQGTILEGSELLAQTAKQYPQIRIINLWEDIPHDKKYYSDSVHPNDKGMEYFFNGFFNALKAMNVL